MLLQDEVFNIVKNILYLTKSPHSARLPDSKMQIVTVHGLTHSTRDDHSYISTFADRAYTVHWPSTFLAQDLPGTCVLAARLELPQLSLASLATLEGQAGSLSSWG